MRSPWKCFSRLYCTARRRTPVQMLSPGKGKIHRAYLWAYTATQFSTLRAVVYDFASSCAGEHARAFLGNWQGKLVCDDCGGYVAPKFMLRRQPAAEEIAGIHQRLT